MFLTKKITVILSLGLFIILSTTTVTGQNTYTWKKYGIKFKSDEKLDISEDSDADYEWDSDYMAVGIEAIPFDEESKSYRNNPKFASRDFLEDMTYTFVKYGKKFPNVKNSFYCIGEDLDESLNSNYSVIVGVIIDKKSKLFFFVTIHCYEVSLKKGLAIINSFKFTKNVIRTSTEH